MSLEAENKSEFQVLIETMKANTEASTDFTKALGEVNAKLTTILTELQGSIRMRERAYLAVIAFLVVAVVAFTGIKLALPGI